MNIDPKIWGPFSWKFIHYITIGYPEQPTEQNKKDIYNFLTSMGRLLPCEKCRYNFSQHLIKFPLSDEITSSRTRLINWLINIHNEVNISTNKPILTYDQASSLYTDSINGLVEHSGSTFLTNISMDSRLLTIIITVILIVIIILSLLCRRYMMA